MRSVRTAVLCFIRGTQGRARRDAIINADRVVKLRALEAIATFHVDGRTLNYRHQAVVSPATINPLTAGVIYALRPLTGSGQKDKCEIRLVCVFDFYDSFNAVRHYVQHVSRSHRMLSQRQISSGQFKVDFSLFLSKHIEAAIIFEL